MIGRFELFGVVIGASAMRAKLFFDMAASGEAHTALWETHGYFAVSEMAGMGALGGHSEESILPFCEDFGQYAEQSREIVRARMGTIREQLADVS